MSLELYKLLYRNEKDYNNVERYRYGSFNLAVLSFGFSESLLAKKQKIRDRDYTLWTKDEHNIDITLRELLKYYNDEEYNVDFIIHSHDDEIIYSVMNDDVIDYHKPIRELITQKKEKYYLTLSLEKIEEIDDFEDDEDDNIDNEIFINCILRN
jgi:ubiquitin-activating enzyme E1